MSYISDAFETVILNKN